MKMVETKLTGIHWAYGVICDLVLTVGLALHKSQGIQISIQVEHTKHKEDSQRVYEGNQNTASDF